MRIFRGKEDPSAIILKHVFPANDLIISAPLQFDTERSGVYIEGRPQNIEEIFQHLLNLRDVYIDERSFGRWLTVTPPDDKPYRTIIHYKTLNPVIDKIQLLNLVLRRHLAEICDLRLSDMSILIVRSEGIDVCRSNIILPEGFLNGKIIISGHF